MSPSDQPVEIRLTLTREEAVAFIERLAREDDFREQFEQSPREVLASHGIEVNPPEAVPSTVSLPDPDEMESNLSEMRAEADWPYIWLWWPYIGLLANPEEAGGYESA